MTALSYLRRDRHPVTRSAARAQRATTMVLCTLLAASAHAQGRPPGDTRPGAPAGPMASPLTSAALVQRLGSMVDALSRQERFSGVVVLAQNGRPILERAYGCAECEAKRPMTVSTSMNVSSVGKLFTQVAIDQLVAAGKLALDSTIATYWPDYPDPVVARTVTLRQLLTHRSGIDGDIFADLSRMRRNRDYVPLATRGPLAFAPGSQQRYSNAGYVVLGEIIERVSGEVYHEYIQRHVFARAGMTASAFPAQDSLPRHAAHGYTRGFDPRAPQPAQRPPLTRADSLQPRRGSAAGGAYANARDLLRFVIARREGTLGTPPRQRQDVSAGGSPGSNVIIAEGLPGGYDLIALANLDPPSAEVIADSVEAWTRGGGASREPGPATVGSGPQRVFRSPGEPGDLPALPTGPMHATMPETPQGRVATQYLQAFSSGDTAQMRTFITTRVRQDGRSVDERVRRYQELFADMGPLTFVGAQVVSESAYTVQVRAERQGVLTMMMTFDTTPPHRIVAVQFRLER